LYVDETAERCDWHIPASHPLESRGHMRAFDGSASLQQPCIAPLYGGVSVPEFLVGVAGDPAPSGRELLRATRAITPLATLTATRTSSSGPRTRRRC
jgi:molybdopterin-containing oxidoreductase family iron-sulfur binding subunit